MRDWSQIKERGSTFSLRVLLAAYQLLGRRIFLALLYPIALYFFLFDWSARRASSDYLARVVPCLPENSPYKRKPKITLLYLHFLEFARALVDKIAAWSGQIPLQHLTWTNRDLFKQAVSTQKGLVIVGAHIGNMEVIRALSESNARHTINALMFTKHSERFNAILSKLNATTSLRIVPADFISPDTIWDLQQRVKAGEIVSLLADRVTTGSPDKVVPVQFLGTTVMMPQGPWLLASMLECPVFLVFCLRNGPDSYHISFERFSDKLEFPRNNRHQQVSETVERYAKRLEYYTLLAPLQWFNFYDFFAPASEPLSSNVNVTPERKFV